MHHSKPAADPEALKKAQESGGNRFHAPELPEPPKKKKDRISMG